jgi:hypothetical protein
MCLYDMSYIFYHIYNISASVLNHRD